MIQSPAGRVAYLTWQLAQAVGARVEHDVRDLELSGAQTLALLLLALSPGSTVADLTRRTTMTPQAMGGAVNGLIAKGWVVAVPAEKDRRAKELSLSSEGIAMAARVEEVVVDINEDLLSTLDVEQRSIALDMVTRMLRRFNPEALALTVGGPPPTVPKDGSGPADPPALRFPNPDSR